MTASFARNTKGTFIVSIDYEYAWGYADAYLDEEDLERIRNEAAITKRLLALFEKHNIPATWAIVGRLLDSKDGTRDSAWFDSEGLIPRIRSSSASHEIGSHSYAHILYDCSDTSRAEEDIRNAKRVHGEHGLPFSSFIFPRNKEKHHDILAKSGIKCFRGGSKKWYDFLPYFLWPLGRGIDYWLPTARTVVATQHESDLLNIPDSMLLVSRKGVQRLLPKQQALRKISHGIMKAGERKEIFHLWFHPSNFSHDTETQFEIFDAILARAAALRKEGNIDIITMGDYAAQISK